jgi:hypothetical protein
VNRTELKLWLITLVRQALQKKYIHVHENSGFQLRFSFSLALELLKTGRMLQNATMDTCPGGWWSVRAFGASAVGLPVC